ncbi:MAG: thioredoxin family protein [bacterium]
MGLFTSRMAKLNNNSVDSDEFIGEFNWENWKQITGWSDSDGIAYIPDETILEKLKVKLKKQNIRFVFFVAEWCGDSHYAAPMVIKLLKLCDITDNRLKLIGVSRDKMSPNIAFQNNIDSIPTLIVQYDDYEFGRIDEYPAVSWEYDILKIVADF